MPDSESPTSPPSKVYVATITADPSDPSQWTEVGWADINGFVSFDPAPDTAAYGPIGPHLFHATPATLTLEGPVNPEVARILLGIPKWWWRLTRAWWAAQRAWARLPGVSRRRR